MLDHPREGVCAWCHYWHVDAPPEWKPSKYDAYDKPDLYDWLVWAEKKHGRDAEVIWPVLTGLCGAAPTWLKTAGAHGCASYKDKSLQAPATMADYFCNRTDADEVYREIREKNKKLKRQVEHHKKLAISRLARLEKAEK